jgi:hypothetical protein
MNFLNLIEKETNKVINYFLFEKSNSVCNRNFQLLTVPSFRPFYRQISLNTESILSIYN